MKLNFLGRGPVEMGPSRTRPTSRPGNLNDPIVFEQAKLKDSSKQGVLKPDEDGCYTIILGALNAFNFSGDYYPYEPARKFFESNSSFMRKIERGVLRAEADHPEPRGMNAQEFASRLTKIDQTRVACTIRKVWLEFEGHYDDQGRKVIAIMGKIFPSGPYGEVLRKQLEAPNEQVCFSIRSFVSKTYYNGTCHNEITQILTFDWVNEGGIYNAKKLLTPQLESLDEGVDNTNKTYHFTKGEIIQAVNDARFVATGTESILASTDELLANFNVRSDSTLGKKVDKISTW